jgi:pilus assembly protein CpaB
MGRRTLLLIASILVAALGTSLVWLYVQGADTRAQQNSELVDVLFLAQDAPAGADAASLNYTTKKVSGEVASGAVRSRAELAGQRLTTAAVTNQILLTTMLGKQESARLRFPKGGALALSISEPNRVPADLKPGDVVDVFAFAQGQAQEEAVPVVRCVTVRTVGPARASQSGGTAATGNQAVPTTIVGFDADDGTARLLYGIVARNLQPALYDHDPKQGC